MLGLKWAMPQSLGQSGGGTEGKGHVLATEFSSMCVFALTQVQDFVLRLLPGRQSVRGSRQGCLAQQQQQREKKQRRSGRSHRLPQDHRPAHTPRYLCLTPVYAQVRERRTSGDKGWRQHRWALDCSPAATRPISTFTCVLAGREQTSHHATRRSAVTRWPLFCQGHSSITTSWPRVLWFPGANQQLLLLPFVKRSNIIINVFTVHPNEV